MDPDEPTHFDLIIVGTGLTESILSAALTKAGYAVLVLSASKSYGDRVASLTLRELSQLPSAASSSSSAALSLGDCTFDLSLPDGQGADAFLSQRFEVSLCPAFVKARGEAIECAIRSRVASYLDFGLVGGIASYDRAKQTWSRVPATKGDVFTNDSLSLVEKRRVTKLLLSLASAADDAAADSLAQPDETFDAFLTRGGLSTQSKEMMYAASLCTLPSEPARRAVRRLRSYITSTGVYGASPFLVGHYGGIGDLVAGYSRVCAVWGGGQILGHKLGSIDRTPTVGKRVVANPLPFGAGDSAEKPPEPSEVPSLASAATQALGVPVFLDGDDKPPTMLTADYVVGSSCHLSTLLPLPSETRREDIIAVQSMYVLDRRPAFPTTVSTSNTEEATPEEEEEDPKMDTKVYVLPSTGTDSGIGNVSMVLTGSKTNSAPAGYYLLHMLVPLLSANSYKPEQVDAVLADALSTLDNVRPLATFTRRIRSFARTHEAGGVPANMIVVEDVPSTGRTESLSETIEECTAQARDLFVKLVGADVPFFASSPRSDEDDDA